MPAASVVAVWQLSTGIVAVHSVDPPDANVTVPVASPGRPENDSVSCDPWTIDAGAAASVIEGVALLIVNVVVVVWGAKFESPE